jgi:predicted nucleotidyltransferase
MELARRGAAFLYQNGASKVWVFGSVAKGRQLDFRSDIDFAVEGISPEKILRVGAELEELLDFPVELIELERARPGLREQIETHHIFLAREN